MRHFAHGLAHKLIATAAMGILVGAAVGLYTTGLPGAFPAHTESPAGRASVICESLTWLRWPAVHRSATWP
jgi:hypothetical protein